MPKITRTIHHNQLLLTRFGRILPYWTDDVKSAVKLHIIKPLTEKNWGRVWVAFELSIGEVSNGRTFYSFHGELLSKNIGRTERRQLDGRHLLFGVYNLLTYWAVILCFTQFGSSHCMSQFLLFRDTAPLSPFLIIAISLLVLYYGQVYPQSYQGLNPLGRVHDTIDCSQTCIRTHFSLMTAPYLSSWSSSPDLVTVKLMMVTLMQTSGR